MNKDKRAKLKDLRQKLANLPAEKRAWLESRALIATVDGRTLSLHNTMMCYMQTPGIFAGNGCTLPTVVGGFKQWLRAGKCVRKGQHGMTIFFPVGAKDDDGEILEVSTYYTATVFDISQVDDQAAQ